MAYDESALIDLLELFLAQLENADWDKNASESYVRAGNGNPATTTEEDFRLRCGSAPKERNVTEVIGLAERCLLLLEHVWRTNSDGRAIHLVENEECDRIEWPDELD